MRRLAIIAALLLLAVPVSGQGWSMTTWFVQTIAIQHNRLDRIKAHQPCYTGSWSWTPAPRLES